MTPVTVPRDPGSVNGRRNSFCQHVWSSHATTESNVPITTFSYQWVANDGSSDTDIPGATNPTYILLAAEEGKSIKVRVSFTDDSDNDETLTSDATAVAAAEVDMIWSVEMLVKDYGNSSLGAYSASLQKLALSNNQLTGTIPTELGDLADTLTELSMANNGFTGCIPPA